MATPKPHYTVTVIVTKTTPEHRDYKDSYDKVGFTVDRVSEELTKGVLRDEQLPEALAKAVQFIRIHQPLPSAKETK